MRVQCAPVQKSLHDDLDGVLVCEQVDDLHGELNDAHSQDLLSVVASVHHQRVGESGKKGKEK